MQEYLVIWAVELTAENSQEAANLALAMQRDPNSTATHFTVQTEGRDEESVDGIPAADLVRAQVLRAMRAAQYEFTCLAPRLSGKFQTNANDCKDMLGDAIKAMGEKVDR